MTSANISNLFVQTNVVSTVNQTQENAEISGNDFMELMKKSDADLMSIAGNGSSEGLTPKASVNVDNLKSADSIKSVETKRDIKENAKISDEVKKQVKEFDEKVTKAVAKELDVSEDEVKEAMQVLGLTAADLTDKSNMAQLISQITGQDSISLVLDDSFTKLNGIVNQLFAELSDSLNLDDNSEFAQMISDVIKAINSEDELEQNVSLDAPKDESSAIDIKTDNVERNDSDVSEKATNVKVENSSTKEVNTQETKDSDTEEITETTDNAPEVKATTENESSANAGGQQSQSFTKQTENKNDSDAIVMPGNDNSNIAFNFENKEVTLPSGQTVDVAKIIEQIVEQSKVTNTAEKQAIEMVLNPEGLGKVYMEVAKNGNEVVAKFFTENEAMKEALESQLANLRDNINNGETKVNAIEVSVGTHEFEKNLEEGQQQTNENQEQQDAPKRTRSINLNNLDELSGLMTEEEQLVAQIMKDNGNTVSLQA